MKNHTAVFNSEIGNKFKVKKRNRQMSKNQQRYQIILITTVKDRLEGYSTRQEKLAEHTTPIQKTIERPTTNNSQQRHIKYFGSDVGSLKGTIQTALQVTSCSENLKDINIA